MEYKDRLSVSSKEQLVRLLKSIKQLKEQLRALYRELNSKPLTDEIFDPNPLSLQVTEIHSSLGAYEKTMPSNSHSFLGFKQSSPTTCRYFAGYSCLN